MSSRPDLLARLDPTRATPRHRPGAVYLLPHLNRLRFKVGWSCHPLLRIQQLPEYAARALDLPAAQVAWFAQAQRAHQVERVLHRSLAPYSVQPGHQGDGRTEWFSMQGIVLARRMLGLLPAADGTAGCARLQALAAAPQPADETPSALTECGALDAWHRVEDLWRRLASVLPLVLVASREQRSLYWVNLRQLSGLGVTLLRAHAVNLDTYEWRQQGQRRCLVSLMDWEQDDLLLQLTPARQLQRWPEGDAVEGQLRAFLALHAQARAPEAGATAWR